MVLVPGLMGAELKRGNEVVWPMRVSETILGYDRIEALQNPGVEPTKVISKFS